MYQIVKRGESLWSIAQMQSVGLQELIAVNPQIKDPNFIMVGEKILLPPGASHIDVPGHPMPPRPNMPGMLPRPNTPGPQHTPCAAAAAAETTEEAAESIAVMGRMPECNDNDDNSNNEHEETTPEHDCGCQQDDLCKRLAALPRPLIYIVRRGDTLSHIAECFEVPLPELLRVNPQVRNPDLIHPGDKIFIPRPRTVIMPPPMHPNHPMHPGRLQPRFHNVDNETTCPHCGRKL